MTSTWLSSHLRTSSSLVLSLRSGDPRILSPAVLSVCLLSQKHIHPMVSVIIPDLSVQWTLLSRAGHPHLDIHQSTSDSRWHHWAPDQETWTTWIPLPYSNHFKPNTKNWQLFFLLSSGFITASSLVLTAVDLGLFLDLFFLDYYNHGLRTKLPHESPSSHPLSIHTHTNRSHRIRMKPYLYVISRNVMCLLPLGQLHLPSFLRP